MAMLDRRAISGAERLTPLRFLCPAETVAEIGFDSRAGTGPDEMDMKIDVARHPHAILEAGLERGHGRAEIRVAKNGAGETAIGGLYQRSPCRVLFPRPEAGDPFTAVVATTSGGLAGGDSLEISAAAGAGCRAVVTTQAAEKVYRALAADCTVKAVFSAAPGAWLEWLPQESILFDGARLRRRTEVDTVADGRLLACDMVVFGRRARGERFTRGLLHDAWRVHRDGALLWADDLHLDGDIRARIDHPAGFAGADAYATIVYVGADGADRLASVRAEIDAAGVDAGRPGALRVAASLVNGVLVIRLLAAEARMLRAEVMRLCIFLRTEAAGLPARMPRVWTI